MIENLIEYCIRNRILVLLVAAGLAVWGVYAVLNTPMDAVPDLSENQVIVFTDWMGRSTREIEDQITYPLSLKLQGLAGVKAIRSSSEFNFSMVTIIFEDGVDYYFARQRVLEKLDEVHGSTILPGGVVPRLAADARNADADPLAPQVGIFRIVESLRDGARRDQRQSNNTKGVTVMHGVSPLSSIAVTISQSSSARKSARGGGGGLVR